MFCTNKCKICGAIVEDTAAFCVMCGAKLKEAEQVNVITPIEIVYDNIQNSEEDKNSPRKVFFKIAGSKKALAAAILLVISFGISFFSTISSMFNMSSNSMISDVAGTLGEFGFETGAAAEFTRKMLMWVNIWLVVLLIITAITTVGIVLIYLDGKNRKLSTRGLTLLKVASSFTMAIYVLIGMLVGMSLFGETNILIIMFSVVLAVFFPIFIQIAMINACDKMKRVVLHDGNISISVIIPVLVIISCAVSLLVSLSTASLLTIAISSVGIVGNILFAICMFDYNNALALLRVEKMYDNNQNRGIGL